MANQPETATYDAGVYQLETVDPVQGGVGGLSNTPLLNLSNRTKYLKQHLDAIEAGTFVPPGIATLASPTFTGTVSGPTAASGDISTKFATTAFVANAIGGVTAVNVAGNSNVNLTAAQYGCGIVILTGVLTGNINVIFPTQGDEWLVINGTTGAFSATCKTAAGTGIAITQGKSNNLACDGTNIIIDRTDFNAISLLGNCTAVTQSSSDNSTKLATTAFCQAVAAASASYLGSGYVQFNSGFIIQWTQYTVSLSNSTPAPSGMKWGNTTVSFPINFPHVCSAAFGTPTVSIDTATATVQIVINGVDHCTVYGSDTTTGTTSTGTILVMGN